MAKITKSFVLLGVLCLSLFWGAGIAAEDMVLTELSHDSLIRVSEVVHDYFHQLKYDSALALYAIPLDTVSLYTEDARADVAQLYVTLGKCYYNVNEMETGAAFIENGVRLAETLENHEDSTYASWLGLLAAIYSAYGEYQQAAELSEEALRIRTSVFNPDHPQIADSKNNLALEYEYLGRFQDAERLHREALELKENFYGPDSKYVGRCVNFLANCLTRQGRVSDALPLYRRALEIRMKELGPDHTDVGEALNNLGYALYATGNYQEALELHLKALAIRQKSLGKEDMMVAISMVNIAQCLMELSHFNEARIYLQKALTIQRNARGEWCPESTTTLNELGGLSLDLGNYDMAMNYFAESQAILDSTFGVNHINTLAPKQSIAYIHYLRGQYDESEKLYQDMYSTIVTYFGPDSYVLNHVYRGLSCVASAREDYLLSEEYDKKAIACLLTEYDSTQVIVGRSYFNLAFSYEGQGKYDLAESYYTRAMNIYTTRLGPLNYDLAGCYENLARLYAVMGDQEKSFVFYERLMKLTDDFINYVFAYSSEDQKLNFVKMMSPIEPSFLSFALDSKNKDVREAAYDMVLRHKAIVIDAMMKQRAIVTRCSDNVAINDLIREYDYFNHAIANLFISHMSGDESIDFKDSIQYLIRQKDSLESNVSRLCSQYSGDFSQKQYTTEDVSKALPSDAALLDIIKYTPYDFTIIGSELQRFQPEHYLVCTIDKNGFAMRDIGPAATIDSLIQRARTNIDAVAQTMIRSRLTDSERSLKVITDSLFALVYQPLEEKLKDKTTIFVSPDGLFYLFPFEIITDEDGRFLIEQHKICYISSGRQIPSMNQSREPIKGQAILFGDPDYDNRSLQPGTPAFAIDSGNDPLMLDLSTSLTFRGYSDCLAATFTPLIYSERETRTIERILKKHSRFDVRGYYHDKATETILSDMSTPPAILHFSTHGFFCDTSALDPGTAFVNPLLLSGLALAGANNALEEGTSNMASQSDGILTAHEISGLNFMGTDLATLSACESGVGAVTSGEGVFGLCRAFKHAGVESLIMSLWKVPDKESAELMEQFYTHWLSGETKLDALRASSLTLIEKCRDTYGTAHPVLWGGFILFGNPN